MEKNKEFNPQESEDSVGADPKGTVNNSYNPKKWRFSLCMDKFSQTSCKIK